MPFGAKSRRAKNMSRVLRPGIRPTVIRVTFDPSGFKVLLGRSSANKKKSSVVASVGNFPLTNIARRKVCYFLRCIGQFHNNF